MAEIAEPSQGNRRKLVASLIAPLPAPVSVPFSKTMTPIRASGTVAPRLLLSETTKKEWRVV